MAHKTTATEIKTPEQLGAELAAKRTELLDARRSHAAGELANPRIIASTKKEIARLMTAIQAAKAGERKNS